MLNGRVDGWGLGCALAGPCRLDWGGERRMLVQVCVRVIGSKEGADSLCGDTVCHGSRERDCAARAGWIRGPNAIA